MQKNVTVRIDEDLLRWARVRAAEADTSVSQLIARMLDREMWQEGQQRRVLQHWTELEQGLTGPPAGWRFSREETHERDLQRQLTEQERRHAGYRLWKANLGLAERGASERASREEIHDRGRARRS